MPIAPLTVRIAGVLVVVFLLAPILIVIPMSFNGSRFLAFPPPELSVRWYVEFFSDPQWLRAATRSLWVATIVALLSTVAGTAAAGLVDRMPVRLRVVAYVLFSAPIILPVIVYAVGIYSTFSYMRIIGSDLSLIIAHSMIAMPFPFLTVTAAYAQYDRTLDKAAGSSGASPWKTYTQVTFPQIRPAVIAGALFAFLSSFDEVVVAMFLGGARSTLPKLMFDDMRYGLSPVIAAIATLLIVLTSVGLLITLRRRRR